MNDGKWVPGPGSYETKGIFEKKGVGVSIKSGRPQTAVPSRIDFPGPGSYNSKETIGKGGVAFK